MKKVLVLVSGVLILGGCGNMVYDILARSYEDPDNFEIRVKSFEREREINCEWDSDERSDEYILMRSEDGKESELKFKEVYRGKRRQYTDKYLKEDKKYLYRLDKVRGKKKFKGRQYYLGVFNGKRRDRFEPNDNEGSATKLDEERSSNVYYYRSWTGIYIEDEDWYEVEIPGFWNASVKLIYGYGDTPFIITFSDNSQEEHPPSNTKIVVTNRSKEKQIKRFKVSLDKAKVGGGGLNVSSFYTYRIKVDTYYSGGN